MGRETDGDDAPGSPGWLEANRPEADAGDGTPRREVALPDWATDPTGKEPGRWLSKLDSTIVSNTLVCTGAAVAEPLMGMADTAFVGHLGLVPLAALGPNNTAFSFISFFAAFSLSVATTDRIATGRSQGNPQEGALSLSISLTLALYLGLAFGAAMLLFPEQILLVIGANDEIMADAVSFMRMRAWSVPAMLVCIAVEGAYRAFLDLKTPFAIIAASAIMNVVLNAALLFGLGMGVRGSALATSASTVASALCFLGLLHWRDRQAQFSASGDSDPDVKELRSNFILDGFMPWRVWRLPAWRREAAVICSRCGVLIMRAALIVSVYSVAGAVAARMGTAEVAGHQVLRQLLSLQVCLTWAYMSVGQTLVANLFESGARGRALASKVARRVITLGSATAALLCAAMWTFRGAVPALVVQDPSALEAMRPAMLPACIMLLASANNAFEGVLLGAGDTAFCSRSFIPASLSAVALLWFALQRHGGLQAIWWALAAYYSVLLALFAARALLPALKGPLNILGKSDDPLRGGAPLASDKVR